jgi:hypothetical protein
VFNPARTRSWASARSKRSSTGTIARGLGPKTVRTDYRVLRAIFSWAMASDIIDRSPCRGIRLPEMVRQRRRWTFLRLFSGRTVRVHYQARSIGPADGARLRSTGERVLAIHIGPQVTDI